MHALKGKRWHQDWVNHGYCETVVIGGAGGGGNIGFGVPRSFLVGGPRPGAPPRVWDWGDDGQQGCGEDCLETARDSAQNSPTPIFFLFYLTSSTLFWEY